MEYYCNLLIPLLIIITALSFLAQSKKPPRPFPPVDSHPIDDEGTPEEAIRIMLTIHTSPPPRPAYSKDGEVSQVCYGDLGCFSNKPPFDNAFSFLPLPPDEVRTEFWLYTRENPLRHQLLNYSDLGTIRESLWSPEKETRFIVHGFASHCRSPQRWVQNMTAELLRYGDMNVICVEWEHGAKLPNYPQAAANTRLVAAQITKLILALESVRSEVRLKSGRSRETPVIDGGGLGMPTVPYHLIGHSLGAHVAGYVGRALEDGYNRKLDRISGLDPAEPFFENRDINIRLDPEDAAFVDVIHTNGAPILMGGAGLKDAVGHVDFYPNGGEVQAGCPPITGLWDTIVSLDCKIQVTPHTGAHNAPLVQLLGLGEGYATC